MEKSTQLTNIKSDLDLDQHFNDNASDNLSTNQYEVDQPDQYVDEIDHS